MNMPLNEEPQSSHGGLFQKCRDYRRELAGIVLGLVVTLLAFYAKDERGFVACLILGPTISLTSLTPLPGTSFLGVRTPGR